MYSLIKYSIIFLTGVYVGQEYPHLPKVKTVLNEYINKISSEYDQTHPAQTTSQSTRQDSNAPPTRGSWW